MGSEYKTSRSLLLIAAILMFIGIANGAFVSYHIESLRHDAEVINELGILRGLTQRTVKNEIIDKRDDHSIGQIDSLLEAFFGNQPRFSPGNRKESTQRLVRLRDQWLQVRDAIIAFREQPDDTRRDLLFLESERSWNIANDTVFAAQVASEAKLRLFRIVFVLIGLNMLAILSIIRLNQKQVRNRLELLAHHDPLTGALNRYVYENRMEEEIQRSRRYDRPLSLLLIDIDRFKEVNDTWGHKKGDQALTALTGAIKREIRNSDSFYRIGGEEFAVIAPETPIDKALLLGEKLRKSVEDFSGDGIPKITVSIGASQYFPEEPQNAFFKRADDALYSAKRNGRNRVESGGADAIAAENL